MRRLVASSLSALNSPHMANNKMTENGKALAMVAVCKAVRPSASKRAIATTPISDDQKMRCHTGEFSAPPEASRSTTSAPESADVTKKTTTMAMATVDVMLANGSCSRKANNASELSCATTWASSEIGRAHV